MMRNFTLLILSVLLANAAIAQSSKLVRVAKLPVVPPSIANKAIAAPANPWDAAVPSVIGRPAEKSIIRNSPSAGASQKNADTRDITDVTIGTTYYDVQTNAAVRNALIRNDDGTMAAVWTMGPTDASGWPDRGTGYNYFDGTAWGSVPTATIAPPRSGWPNVVNLANGKEFVLSHNTTDSQLELDWRDTKGSGAWNTTTSDLISPIPQGNWWPKMIRGGNDGNSIHAVSITYPTGSGGIPYHGVDGALLYSRSTDGGATWDKINASLPGIDSTAFTHLSSDSYAMDTKGDEIVIAIGGSTSDVVLLKSQDNGNTWTKTPIFQFPIPLYEYGTVTDINEDGIADTLDSNDGSVAVLIDNNNLVHVWFGYMRIINDGSFSTFAYFPGTNGLVYWDESMENGDPLPVIAGAPDLDGDGVLNVAAIGTYNQGLSSWPSPGIDAAGNIFVSYGACMESTDANPYIDGDGKNLRQTFVMISHDSGLTWDFENAINVITDPFAEGVWGTMVRNVDDKIRLIYQRDYCTGFSVPGSDGSVADPCNIGQSNDIVYVSLDAGDLVGVNEANSNASGLSIFPNPSNGTFTVTVPFASNSTIDAEILNSLGQVIRRLNHQQVFAGKVNFNLNDLPAGLYVMHIKSGEGISSLPFSISK